MQRRLDVRVVVGLVLGPVGLGVVRLQALVEDQSLVREALEAHVVLLSSSSVSRSEQGVPADLAQRRVAGVQGAGPAVGRPAGRLVEAARRPGRPRAATPAGGRRRRPPARSATAASSRLPCPRRPQRGSTSSVEISVVGPAGSGCSPAASSGGPEGGEADHGVPLQRDQHAVRRGRRRGDRGAPGGLGGVGSSQSSSTAGGQHRPVRRPPGDHLDPGDLRGVLGAGRPHRGVGGAGQARERGLGSSPGQRRRADVARSRNVVPARQDRRP